MFIRKLVKENNEVKIKMKNQLTIKDISNIPKDALVELVAELTTYDKTIHKKVQKLALSQNPKDLYKSILKDINSIKRGRKFIEYGKSFEFAKIVKNIVEDIKRLVKDDKEAASLLKALILADSKVYLRSDDSAGVIQDSYAFAEDEWKRRVKSLDDEQLLKDLKELLICEGFGMRDIFSADMPKETLLMLYDSVYAIYEKQEDRFDRSSYHHVLLAIADTLVLPELYIKTKELEARELHNWDYFEIARVYQKALDVENTLIYLKKVSKDFQMIDDVYKMLIWVYEQKSDTLQITLTYKEWYEQTKSPDILKSYLSRLDGKAKEIAKQDALNDAKKLDFSSAINLFFKLDEKELCASYILSNQDNLQTQYIYNRDLKRYIKWLESDYPQEVILLYRDVCEKALETKQSKYYTGAIWALKEMVKLEAKNQPIKWKMEENSSYIQRLLKEHKLKRRFIELFDEAFG